MKSYKELSPDGETSSLLGRSRRENVPVETHSQSFIEGAADPDPDPAIKDYQPDSPYLSGIEDDSYDVMVYNGRISSPPACLSRVSTYKVVFSFLIILRCSILIFSLT